MTDHDYGMARYPGEIMYLGRCKWCGGEMFLSDSEQGLITNPNEYGCLCKLEDGDEDEDEQEADA